MNLESLNRNAWEAQKQGRYEEALKLFDKLAEQSTSPLNKAWAWSNSAYPLVKLKQHEAALARVTQAYQSTKDSHFLHQIAFVERELGNYKKALDFIEHERSLIDTDNLHRLCVNSYEQAKLRQLLGLISESHSWAEKCKHESKDLEDWIAKACAHRVTGDQLSLEKKFLEAQVQYCWAQWCFIIAKDSLGLKEVGLLQAQSPLSTPIGNVYFSIPDLGDSKVCEKLIKNRADSFFTSFGTDEKFWSEFPDGSGYIEWLKSKLEKFPASIVCLYLEDTLIGQLEFGRYKPQPDCGYVNLFYLIPEFRSKGAGALLNLYTECHFAEDSVQKLLLSVSPKNSTAIRFYSKHGWKDLGPRPNAPEGYLMEKSI